MRALALLTLLLVAACTSGQDASNVGSSEARVTSSIVIGEPNVLPTADSGNANLIISQVVTLSQTATLRSLSFYVTRAAGKLRLGVYDATGPSGGPGHKLAETGDINPAVGWNTASVTASVLSPGNYWLCYLTNDNNLAFTKVAGNSDTRVMQYWYGVMPATFTTQPGSTGFHWSLYATLDAAASSDPPPSSPPPSSPPPSSPPPSSPPPSSPPPSSSTIVLGEPNVLPTADSGNANLIISQVVTLSQTATLKSLSFYVTHAAGKLRLGVYDATGPTGGPGHKVTEAEINTAVGWNTASVTPIQLNPGNYWLCYLTNDNNLAFTKVAGNSDTRVMQYWYGVMPATFATQPVLTGLHWSLYATLDGAASTDPCAGSSCNTPPPTQCISGTTLRKYSATGTCNAGNCSYSSTDTICTGTCQNAACVSNTGTGGLPGPLKVSSNPNYFQDTTGRAVALFGSHTWNSFQDWGTNAATLAFDFTGFTNSLVAHGQNFTMLWRTELPKFCGLPTMADGSKPDMTTNFQPWLRTGPGTASDGGPRFDLSKFDQSYFDRLRSRVSQLNDAGIWVAVYLFTGEWLNALRCSSDGYPFTGGNNVNSIDDGGGNGSMTMTGSNAITDIQDAMADKTVDTLNDLPNVIWIVSEEASSQTSWWQQHMIAHVRSHEAAKPYRHPVGIGAMEYGTPDSAIINTDADWVSPFARLSSSTTCGSGSPSCKVNINDSDHSYYGIWNDSRQANRQYAWENFARGNQVTFMDPYTVYYPRENRNLCSSPVNGMCAAPDSRWDNFRNNLGYLVTYSRKMNLNLARDRSDLCSTSYCLGSTPANGTELLVYAPYGGSFSVNLSSAAGRTMHYEWFDPEAGTVVSSGSIQGGNASQGFATPAAIPADSVLYVVDAAGHG